MNALKWIVGAFIAGQTAIMRKKDETFKKGIEEKKGLDKIGFWFEKLFHLNQELFADTKQTLKKLDIDAELTKAKETIETEAAKLKSFMVEKEGEVESLGKKKAQVITQEAEKRYHALKSYVQGYADSMIKKYHLQEKLDEVKATYEVLKKKVNDIKEA